MTRPDRPAPWWKAPGLLDAAVEALVGHGLWPGFDHWGYRTAARRKRIADPAALLAAARSWRPGYIVVQRGDARYAEGSSLALDVAESELGIALWLDPSDLRPRADTVLDAVVGASLAIDRAMGATWSLDPDGGAALPDLAYPRCRPPFSAPGWLVGAAINLVPRAAGDERGPLAPALEAALPAGVSRTAGDRLVAIRWAAGLADPTSVASALSAQERWTRDHLETTRDAGFNAAGDQRIIARLRPAPPYVLYDEDQREGYVAGGAWSDGTVDEASLEEVARLVTARDPEPPVGAVSVLVQDRAVAIASRDRFRAAGAHRVAYLDEGGGLWDPFPPGLWQA